jgi:predicted nucleic acid-binding protein
MTSLRLDTELADEAAELLGVKSRTEAIHPAKLRDLHFDVLIVLTARSHGARLITSNRADFELIRHYRKFELELW